MTLHRHEHHHVVQQTHTDPWWPYLLVFQSSAPSPATVVYRDYHRKDWNNAQETLFLIFFNAMKPYDRENICSPNDLEISTIPLFLFTCMWADLLICQLWDWYCGSIAKGIFSPAWQPEFKLQDLHGRKGPILLLQVVICSWLINMKERRGLSKEVMVW